MTAEGQGFLWVPRCPFRAWRLATFNIVCRVQCSTDHVPILLNFLHVENAWDILQLLNWVPNQETFSIYIIQHVQPVYMHSIMKSCWFWFLNLPFSSCGYRIFFFSLQIDNLLSFQASVEFLSSSIPVNGSWRDIPAGSTLGSTAGSMQRLVAPIWMLDTCLILSRSGYLGTWAQSWSHDTLRLSSSEAKMQGSMFVWRKNEKPVWGFMLIAVAKGFYKKIR